MNNLKFRAWDKTAKKMSKVTAIDFSTKPFRVFYKAYGNENYFNQDAILMQSTGLHDKNGVEIFEGDILKTRSRGFVFVKRQYGNSTVKYQSGTNTTTTVTLSHFMDKYKIEVVGNIYENKELIENE